MDNQRSPRYPAVSLSEAIEAARSVWSKEKRTPVTAEVLAKALGYASLSGGARTKIASMRQYGLLERVAGAALRLSELGMKIIHSATATEDYRNAVQQAALKPDLFQELHQSHADGSEDAIKSFLILRKGFSDSGARLAATAYRDTLSFANRNGEGYTEEDDSPEDEVNNIEVGQYVQWESQGVLQFPAPRRVRAISEDGEWAFVDGSNTGVSIKELKVMEAPSQLTKKTPPPAPPMLPDDPTMWRDVFSLSEGPVTIQWPASLSPESYQDLSDWLTIVKRKIGRSVPGEIKIAVADQLAIKDDK